MKPAPEHPWRVRNRQQAHSAKVKRNLGLVPVVHTISPAEIVPATVNQVAAMAQGMAEEICDREINKPFTQ